MSRKRHSVIDKDGTAMKRQRRDVQITSNEDPEFSNNLPDQSRYDIKLDDTCQTKQFIPHYLIGLKYHVDLSILCSLRKFIYEDKYTSLSLAFGSSETDKFSNIVLRCDKNSIHVHIKNVDNYYVNNNIGYAKLFTRPKGKRSFFINDYFDSFVKHIVSDGSSNNVDYLIIYTNSRLELTKERKLKKERTNTFFPFQFDIINIEECDILRDFLFTNDNEDGRAFYQFLKDDTSKEELSKRLKFSSAMLKVINEKQLSEKELKEAFLDKLVFAVNQPNREELNTIVKREIKNSSRIQDDYIALQGRVISDLTDPVKNKKLANDVSEIIYEFNLLMFFFHDMFLNQSMAFINFEGKDCDVSNAFAVNYKVKNSYVNAHNADSNIGFSQLFPSQKIKKQSKFSINKHFSIFIEELEKVTDKNIKYFIIYTNKGLNLTREKTLKKTQSKDSYPLKLEKVNVQKKKYKLFRDRLCINKNGLYQFSQEETTKLSDLLKLPLSAQKEKEEGRLSDENENEMKEKFLAKLILAVDQPNREQLSSIIKTEIDKSDGVPYNYEELHEMALRWSESHEYGSITKEVIKKLLGDIKNNRSSYQGIQNRNIDEEIKFAKSVIGGEGSPTFNQFLDFLIIGKGKKYLKVLKENSIQLPRVSSILNKAGINGLKAFKDLFDLWFDMKGSKTQYLRTLEEEGVNLASICSVLNGAGFKAEEVFKELYDMWFDLKGSKTQQLRNLEEEGLSLATMSSILNGAGTNAANAFKDFYDLWFDGKGNKTQYLKSLEEEGVNLAGMSSVLNRTGSNAVKAFKKLYDLCFDVEGNKTQYLRSLENEEVNLARVSSILSGAGVKASKSFEELYNLWFDVKGSKTQQLRTLEEEGVSLVNMTSILSRAAANAPKAFKELYDLWFDAKGNKTHYLRTLEKEGISLTNISSILNDSGANAPKAFKELYNIFFDEQGKKRQQLKHFIKKKDEKESFTLDNLSSILYVVGSNVKTAFEKLHSVCFDDEGKRTKLLEDFYNAGFRPDNLSIILCRAGVRASSILQKLHAVCFNEKGEKTKLLDDFYNVGLGPDNLCNILCGAADNLKQFHDFCFVEKTKVYLNHFLNDKKGFTLKRLSNILLGARANICSALEDFHGVCFDEIGNKTELLDDFHSAGLRSKDLSKILSRTGNNAASILQNFHKSCFNKRNYLNHFLVNENLFTPKSLSKILEGAGMKVCPVFKELHKFCFHKTGEKKEFLNRNRPTKEIINELYAKFRGSSLEQQDIITVEENENEDDNSSIKIERKPRKRRDLSSEEGIKKKFSKH